MILYEPINIKRSSTQIPPEELYFSEELALMPLVSSCPFEEHGYSPENSWQYGGTDSSPYPFFVFGDDEDNEEDIDEDDNFDDLDDDFDDEFEDDDFDDDDEYDDFDDDDYDDDDYDEDEFDE